MVFGCLNWAKNSAFIIMFVLGIIFSVCGFYVMPVLWVFYGEIKTNCRLCNKIKNGCNKISELAIDNSWNPNYALDKVNECIKKHYLEDYYILMNEHIINKNEGVEVKKNNGEILSDEIKSMKCPNCGAEVIVDKFNIDCPYCGTKRITKKNQNSKSIKFVIKK